ncbi:bifunctional phosphopantothenoylcysteine decarboxylase/phosphopantothenate--cysteine ligase CoaBC [Treponema pedis]|uniref:bifunctional phosphopantothenoylcysteine decarboxylase/phosphopantothenate--cysteine ligase CoaBC n=1 Tax=Treponema pedis TaxID=409322 RepID=UPI00040B8BC3|nr:bifunctional phosphopantothenoylcysteine decarboxylase/phosphopantothenate--cysteine ligase CoaBC [Treponema pedis]
MKNIVLGVTGGIAAYKACEIASTLIKHNVNVDVIMTKNAENFINPLTFQAISKNRVITDMFEKINYWEIEHIALAKKANLFLIAPATANIIAKIANGIADDMLSTTALATKAKIIIAPAMNTDMYENPATQHNLEILKKRGVFIIEPISGNLACRDIGKGKMESPGKIVEAALFYLNKTDTLAGKKVIVTAGASIEDIDPVRFITNRSSGKMGYALASQAALMGANVVLVTYKTDLTIPYGVEKTIKVRNAEDMYNAVLSEYETADIVIKAAAVADFTPKKIEMNKIKKSGNAFNLELVPTKDILAELGKRKKNRILVGFAAETENIETYALEKMKKKNLDLIVANNVLLPESGFASDNNTAVIYKKDGIKLETGKLSKRDLAGLILREAISGYRK